MTTAFDSFIDLGGEIHDQMIRNEKKQKMIVIMRAIKFQTYNGSAIRSEGINSSLAENISFSIVNIWIPPFLKSGNTLEVEN
jgi:hypothetical protein